MAQNTEKKEVQKKDVAKAYEKTLPKNISAKDAVMFLALKKALYVEQKAAPGSIIIAADTVVYKEWINIVADIPQEND
mgnify:CR=1 FL=1